MTNIPIKHELYTHCPCNEVKCLNKSKFNSKLCSSNTKLNNRYFNVFGPAKLGPLDCNLGICELDNSGLCHKCGFRRT